MGEGRSFWLVCASGADGGPSGTACAERCRGAGGAPGRGRRRGLLRAGRGAGRRRCARAVVNKWPFPCSRTASLARMGGAGGVAPAQCGRACSAAGSAAMSGPGPGPGPGGGKLDINRAGVAELEGALSGIGRRRARGIVRKREVRLRAGAAGKEGSDGTGPPPSASGRAEEPQGPGRASRCPPRPPAPLFPSARSGPGPPGSVSGLSLSGGSGGAESTVTVRWGAGAAWAGPSPGDDGAG